MKASLGIVLAAWLGALVLVAQAAPEDEFGPARRSVSPLPGRAEGAVPAHAAPAQIDLSTMNYVDPQLLATGTPFDLCFNVTVQTPDLEWMDRFDVNLPDNWTVHSVAPVPPTACGTVQYGVEPGSNVVYWQTSGYPTDCGAWGEGNYGFCANVTVPNCGGAPWSLAWNIVGDGYGAPEHTRSGSVSAECLAEGVHLVPPSLQIEGCNGLPLTRTLRLINNTGAAGTFELAYASSSGSSFGGPAQIAAAQGQTVDFRATITPGICAATGQQAVGHLEATGGGGSDSASITVTVLTADRWELAWSHPVACFNWLVESVVDPADGLEYNYVAGCNSLGTYRYDPRQNTWMSLAGQLPDYLYDAGDGAAYDGHIFARSDSQADIGFLYNYNVATDEWTASPVPAGVPDRREYEAVELAGKIYFLGGLKSDMRVTAQVDRYNPAGGEWEPVAPLIHARSNAMAWAWDGKIYVAGGMDDESDLMTTEVYDPDSDTWTENPDLFAPLPAAWHGAGDAVLDGRLWLVGGYKTDHTADTLYWTPADNAWRAGPALEKVASNLEASVLAGQIYAVGGFDGEWLDFNQRLLDCPDCNQRGWLAGQVLDGELSPAAPACTTATLAVAPGAFVAPVDAATGYYGPLALVPGSYEATAGATGYGTETVTVSIADGITTAQQIDLFRPRVAAGPPAVVAAAPYSLGITATLAITNSGHLPLVYDVEEQSTRAAGDLSWVSAAPSAGTVAPAGVQEVALALRCSAAQAGQVLSGSLRLRHDDPCAAPVDIPLRLNCQAPDIYVLAPPLHAGLCPMAGGTLAFSVCNHGSADLAWAAHGGEGAGWLAVSPAGGSLLPGACRGVDLHLDATGQPPGEQSGLVTLSSNDPDEPQVGLPVTLTVLAAVEGTTLAWSPHWPQAGQVVHLTASVAAGMPPFTYTWDLGDGSEAGGAAVDHAFAALGSYTLVLTVENRCGLDTASRLLQVAGPPFVVHLPLILKTQASTP